MIVLNEVLAGTDHIHSKMTELPLTGPCGKVLLNLIFNMGYGKL